MGKKKNKHNLKNVAIILKVNRLLNGLSVAALADGICEKEVLKEIEAGVISPTNKILKQLFKRLALTWEVDQAELDAGYKDLLRFNKEFMFNEFDVTNKLFSNLESSEKSYLLSSYILDYLIAKMCYNSVQNRQSYQSLKTLLSTITEHMNAKQKYHYYLCLGIDQLKVMKDIKLAGSYFTRASNYYSSGQINYWFAYMKLKDKRPIAASKYIERALALYVNEANNVGIVSSFEMKGLINYSTSEYLAGISQYKKALEFTAFKSASSYVPNIKNMIAWGYMRMGDYKRAKKYIVNDRYNSDDTVNASVTKFLVAIHSKDCDALESLKPEFSFRNRSLHRMIYAVLQKDKYFDNDNWLIEDDEMDAIFEFAQYTHFELEKAFAEIAIEHYRQIGDYQKAFAYVDSLSAERNNINRN